MLSINKIPAIYILTQFLRETRRSNMSFIHIGINCSSTCSDTNKSCGHLRPVVRACLIYIRLIEVEREY